MSSHFLLYIIDFKIIMYWHYGILYLHPIHTLSNLEQKFFIFPNKIEQKVLFIYLSFI